MSNIDKFLTVGLFISALLTVSTLFYDCRPLRVFFLIMLLVFQMACYYRTKKKWDLYEKIYYCISNWFISVFAMGDPSIDFVFVRESRKTWRDFWSLFCNRWNWYFYWLIKWDDTICRLYYSINRYAFSRMKGCGSNGEKGKIIFNLWTHMFSYNLWFVS